MMRTPELQEKAKEWGLKFITIETLQDYRKRHDSAWWTGGTCHQNAHRVRGLHRLRLCQRARTASTMWPW